MRIARGWPELTTEEAERFWLPADKLCALAAIGESADPKVKKMLNHLSDRNHLPFVKTGPSKTHPRHYSLVSAAMLRTYSELVASGKTYVFAEPVAKMVAGVLLETVAESSDLGDMENRLTPAWAIFSGVRDNGEPASLTIHRSDRMPRSSGLEFGALDAGYLAWRITENYCQFWRSDLEARGLVTSDQPAIGADGWPVGKDGGAP